MFQYLEKYNNLPASLRSRMSSEATTAAIKNLEFKYGLSLASIVMRVMIKDIPADNILSFLLIEQKMNPSQARELSADLKHIVFYNVGDYIYSGADANFYDNLPKVSQEKSIIKNDGIIIPASRPSVIETPVNKPEAQKVVEQLAIHFGSRELNDRLLNIINTYLKGVRNKLAIKDTLMKPTASGGLDFDEDTTNKLIELCAKINNVDPIEAIKNFAARDVEYDFTALKNKTEEKLLDGPGLPMVEEENLPMVEKELPAPMVIAPRMTDIAWPVNKNAPIKEAKISVEPIIEVMPTEIKPIIKAEPIINIPKNDAGKVVISDIKNKPRTFSPVDELAFMTIKNFRQLNNDPIMATDLVRRKIEAIASDDYTRRIEAVNAWKVSPVNRMYVQVLKDALNSGMSAAKALAKRLKEEPEFLSSAEFEAVIQLNRDLSK